MTTMIFSGHGVPTRRDFIAQGILIGVFAALVAIGVALSIVTHQWMPGILFFILPGAGLVSSIFRWWRTGYQL